METPPPNMPPPPFGPTTPDSREVVQITIMALVASDQEAIDIKRKVQNALSDNPTANIRFSLTPQPRVAGR